MEDVSSDDDAVDSPAYTVIIYSSSVDYNLYILCF